MDQLEGSASEGLISKDTIMDVESCDIIMPSPVKPAAEVQEEEEEEKEEAKAAAAPVDAEATAPAAEEDEEDQDKEESRKQQLEAELVEVSIDAGESDKEAADEEAAKRDEDEEEEQEGGGGGAGGGGGKQKQRRPKKGFVQSLLGVLKKSTTKGFAATPADSPQQSVSSKSFLRGLRPLISRIRKNEAPAAASGSSSGSSLARATYSDKDVQTAIREARDNLQGAHDVAEKIFNQNMGD